jgi:hypothetical protein
MPIPLTFVPIPLKFRGGESVYAPPPYELIGGFLTTEAKTRDAWPFTELELAIVEVQLGDRAEAEIWGRHYCARVRKDEVEVVLTELDVDIACKVSPDDLLDALSQRKKRLP